MEQKRRVRDVAHLWCDKRVMRLFRRLTQIKAKNEHKHLKLVYVALCEIDSDFSEFRNHPTYGIKSLTKTCATYAGMEEGAVNAYMKILRRAGLIDYGMRSNEKGQFCGSWLELYEYDEQWEVDLPVFVERMIKNRQEGKQEEQDVTVYGVNPIGPEPNRVCPGLIRNTTCNKPYKNDKSDIKTSSSKDGEFQIPSKRTKPPIDHQAIIDAWNKAVDGTAIPKVIKSTSKRITHIRARTEDLPTIEDWRQLFDKVKSSPFLRGENDRGWTADFDWVVGNDTNFVKVLEGKYKPTTLSQPIKKASQERGCRNLELSDEKRQFYRNGGECVDFTPNLKGR